MQARRLLLRAHKDEQKSNKKNKTKNNLSFQPITSNVDSKEEKTKMI